MTQTALAYLLALLREAAIGTVAAIVPSPYRDTLERECGVDVPLWSAVLGLVEAPAGILLFMAGCIGFITEQSGSQGLILLENWFPGLHNYHFQGVGVLNWLAWFMHPASWVTGAIAATGLTRLAAFAAGRVAVAEPVVLLAMRLVEIVIRGLGARRELRQLGPPRPDRLLAGVDQDLVLLACRRKPDWNELITLQIGTRFYRVISVETRADGDYLAFAYRLKEESRGVFRRLIRYDGRISPD